METSPYVILTNKLLEHPVPISVGSSLSGLNFSCSGNESYVSICGSGCVHTSSDNGNEDEFIDFEFVINLFKETQLKCYYCEKQVFGIHDNVLESKQWTVERIDNRLGHNKNNSVMACLECNLKRRCMYHERYIMTKKLSLIKLS